MKTLILIILIFASTLLTGFAQTGIPVVVSNAFNQKFPAAKEIKWGKENSHEYEASFKIENLKYSANYSDKGEWLETESPLTFEQLPEEVKNTFNVSHKRAEIKAVAKIESSKGLIKYEIEIKKNGKNAELFYNTDGTETIE